MTHIHFIFKLFILVLNISVLLGSEMVFGAVVQGPDPFGEVKPVSGKKNRSARSVKKTGACPVRTKGLIAEPEVTVLPTENKRFALIIGVDQYADTQINGLQGASNDARLLSQTLVKHANLVPDQVLLLTSDQKEAYQPTRANILQKLTLLARTMPRDGMLLLAFSGHGIEMNGQAFLLPSDAKVDPDINLLNETCINVNRVKDLLRGFGIQQVLVVLDTCRNELVASRSGAFDALKPDFSKAFRFDVKNREVRAFATLYATSVGERAYEYSEKKQGYFTLALAEALSGKAADAKGQITLAGMVAYVQAQVPKRVRLELGREQHPFAEIGGYKAEQLVVSVVQPSLFQPEIPKDETVVSTTALPSASRSTVTFVAETGLVNSVGTLEQRKPVKSSGFNVELPGNLTLEMISVPAGNFVMGASPAEIGAVQEEFRKTGLSVQKAAQFASLQGPQQTVSVKGFHLGRFEVTQAQWTAVAALPKVARDLVANPAKFQGNQLPVENVSWLDAVEFCARLSKATGRNFRLPTEIEWEYACRAGAQTPFAFGNGLQSEIANFDDSLEPKPAGATAGFRNKTLPVGDLKLANAFGLFDMHGSVWEWCADSWTENLSTLIQTGPSREGQPGPALRPVRGGSWFTYAVSCRSTSRMGINLTEKSPTVGFRVVCD
ncbi:MAG: SUMF1/EgtB/PvdO family nonheme iron enzyme [Blastocatellia bacterium]|nr:SUMF1/EgtB/PvdO family nonheme iron enzyme [Blastocatellia bacterium]